MHKKLVCFGDSLTARKEGYEEPLLTSMLADHFEEWSIINSGVPGNTSSQALARMKKDVLAHKPDIVTILLGSNDAGLHKLVPLLTYRRNLEKMIRQIGPEKIVLISPPPVDETKQNKRTNQVMVLYAQTAKLVATQYKVPFIDFFHYLYFRKNCSSLLKGVADDGLHFGEGTYELLCELVIDTIENKFL